MQARYQYGTLNVRKRKKGSDVWQWRWYEDGRRKSVIVGTVERLPSRAAALRVTEAFRLRINSEVPQARIHSTTVDTLIDRYIAEEMPKRCRYSTQESYLTSLSDYIRPRWGDTLLQNVRAMAVEEWLGSLSKKSEPREQLSPRSKTHVRNLLHLLFQCAMRWELVDRNPIALVRQSGGRMNIPRILSPEEFLAVLSELKEPYKTMVLIAGGLGLRASEVVGLQWGDFDWEALSVMISRSVVHGRTGETKTEASRKPMPLHAFVPGSATGARS
jgi:integrase